MTADGYTPALYADLAALIAAGPILPPAPTFGMRNDGIGLFYEGHYNAVFGDPESGKTLLTQCVAADSLFLGKRVLSIDLDHNGAPATASRFQALGISADVIGNPDLFRYAEPESAADIARIIEDCKVWQPHLVIIDSIGELLPLYGASSNSPDDFTRVHSAAIKPLAMIGACVLGIDHLAKNSDSRNYGASGTAAKLRAVGGTSIRVVAVQKFTPGAGGRAELTIHKDRHGGLRAHSPAGDREPLAAKFVLTERDGALHWSFYAPDAGESAESSSAPLADIDAIAELDPPPTSVDDARKRLRWNQNRASTAMRAWRDRGAVSTVELVA